jgi:hypothetical protein
MRRQDFIRRARRQLKDLSFYAVSAPLPPDFLLSL